MDEVAELVALAKRLEGLTAEAPADASKERELEALIETFNRRAQSACTRETFRTLYKSQEAEELVAHLLEVRDAPPMPGVSSTAELVALVEGAETWVQQEHAGKELARRSKLPEHFAEQLGTGWGELPLFWPSAAARVEFALAYEPPRTAEELLALARRWLDDRAHRRATGYAALGADLVREAQAQLAVPELVSLCRALGSGSDARIDVAIRAAMERLGVRGPEPQVVASPEATPTPPAAAVVRYRHPTFGEGTLVSRAAGDKLTIRFETGEKTLLSRFVEPVD